MWYLFVIVIVIVIVNIEETVSVCKYLSHMEKLTRRKVEIKKLS